MPKAKVTAKIVPKVFWSVMMLMVLGSAVLGCTGRGSLLKTAAFVGDAYRHTAVAVQVIRVNADPWLNQFYHALITPGSIPKDAVPVATGTCDRTMPPVLKKAGLLHHRAADSTCVAPALVPSIASTITKAPVQPVALAPPKMLPPSVSPTVSDPSAEASTEQPAAAATHMPDLEALGDRADCSDGRSLNVVAHEDDDLLFLNPDIQTDIQTRRCIRTVYITAGDNGEDATYWNGRQDGAKAAYALMYGVPDNWTDKTEMINDRPVTVSYLNNVPQIALTFLHLPDGNLRGEGFAATNSESLQKLITGDLPLIHTIDNKSAYTKDDIVNTLLLIMQTDWPDVVHTQNPAGAADGDHADHAAVGTLTRLAAAAYILPHKFEMYIGYPDRSLAANLPADQSSFKQSIFLAYAQHDSAMCRSDAACAPEITYGDFLTREYTVQ